MSITFIHLKGYLEVHVLLGLSNWLKFYCFNFWNSCNCQSFFLNSKYQYFQQFSFSQDMLRFYSFWIYFIRYYVTQSNNKHSFLKTKLLPSCGGSEGDCFCFSNPANWLGGEYCCSIPTLLQKWSAIWNTQSYNIKKMLNVTTELAPFAN